METTRNISNFLADVVSKLSLNSFLKELLHFVVILWLLQFGVTGGIYICFNLLIFCLNNIVMTHLCRSLQVEKPIFVKYIRNEDKKTVHCAFWCPFCMFEFRQTDDPEGKLFAHIRDSESTFI